MADKTTASSKTEEVQSAGWEKDAHLIGKLAKALSAAVRSKAFGKPEFAQQTEETNILAAHINCNEARVDILQRK